MSKWYQKSGPDGDVVISTRIRLARNLREYPFPNRMNSEQFAQVEDKVKDAVMSANQAFSSMFHCIELSSLNKEERVAMVERHLVSPDFISEPNHRELILSNDEEISIMVNEEDHLRIQVMKEGMQLSEVFAMADRIDTLLNERLNFAFDDELGYLTQCPTNLGTGLRASLMMHLPGLQESGVLARVNANLNKLGFVLRGMYGEGSQAAGAVYQLSNQVTLGLSEKDALENLTGMARQIIRQEREARKQMREDINMQDKIARAKGILSHARMLSSSEFMDLISCVRLGVAEQMCSGLSLDTVNALMIEAQPASISSAAGHSLTPQERDIRRAELVRQALSAPEK